MVSASFAPLLAFVIARLAGATALEAANVGLAVTFVLLAFHGWRAAVAAQLRGWQLFAAVGSTQRLAELGDARWTDLLARHDDLARREIERHRGQHIDSAGDGLLASFDGPARAVRCAQALGAAVSDLGLGIHTGEIELAGDRIRGLAVHIGARVGALARAGEILVSSTVKDLTAGSGLVFEDAGEHRLKGVPDRWRLYRVLG